MSPRYVGFIPAAPLLIPDVSPSARDADLRHAVRRVIADAVEVQRSTGSTLTVIGTAPQTRDYSGTWDFARVGVPRSAPPGPALPTSLAIAAWFLDEVGASATRRYLGVDASASVQECLSVGGEIAADGVLIVVGDGSARHGDKAPGADDPRAPEFDARVIAALADGAPDDLLSLDANAAAELMVDGRAPWQIAAAAAMARSWSGHVLLQDARHGVGYIVAAWTPAAA
jgi:hypothetical protein